MKKLLLSLAALLVSGAVVAQPGSPPRPRQHAPGVDARHDHPRHGPKRHAKKKVWVPAHREHGRLVRGHYVWR